MTRQPMTDKTMKYRLMHKIVFIDSSR